MSELAGGLATIDHDTGELVPAVAAVNLFGTDDPNMVIARATEHAKALADVIQQRNLWKRIGDKNYVLVEAWTMLGSMLGVFPVEDGEAEPIEVNGVQGFKASVNAVTRSGEIVGRATAYCMRDEALWKSRDNYALASMAQTRATSKALRMPLGFIVTLAGYNATPAEEMPTVEAPVATPTDKLATAAQHAKLNASLKELSEKAPIRDQQSWTSALKRWAKELGFPGSRKQWSTVQMSAAIEHVRIWLEDEAVPFLNENQTGALPDSGGSPREAATGEVVASDDEPSPSLGDGSLPPDSAPMSAKDFDVWLKSMNVTDDQLAEAWGQVIVGKTKMSQLTDLDRGLLRDALAVRLTEEAVA